MKKTTQPYWLWFHIYMVQMFLPGVIMAGCGSDENASQPRPAAMAAVGGTVPAGQADSAARGPISQNGKAPIENKKDSVISSAEELTELSKLRALPLLAPLSDREIVELIRRVPGLSPSGRLTVINNHSELATLTNQQKQQLLNQIENIVPVTIPAVLLICDCGNDVHPRLCVPESCSDRSEIQSLCNQACGTLPAFRSQCLVEQRC